MVSLVPPEGYFACKYVYILHGGLKNASVFVTYAHWCAKTLEKTMQGCTQSPSTSRSHMPLTAKFQMPTLGWYHGPEKVKQYLTFIRILSTWLLVAS